MLKAFLFSLCAVLATGGLACAQTKDLPQQDGATNGAAGARSAYVTSTGETVPNPGASQSAGTTSLDRGIQQQDNKIQSSICKGC